MTLDYKGFTEKEIQDIIDWKLQCKQVDEIMWKQHATEIIKKVIMDSMVNEPIGKATKSLDEIEKMKNSQLNKTGGNEQNKRIV